MMLNSFLTGIKDNLRKKEGVTGREIFFCFQFSLFRAEPRLKENQAEENAVN